jgi:RNA polymerase sigma factor (sigma-70 family)
MKVLKENLEENDLLELLRKDISVIQILSREEEYEVAREAQRGDRQAMNRLAEANIRFVIKTAFEHWRPGLPLMDMISEGCLGLMRAIETFDPDSGFRLLTYAEQGIKWRIINVIKDFRRHEHDSLDTPIYEDEELTIKDFLVSGEPAADEKISQKQILALLNYLNDRERKVIFLRFWYDKTLDEVGLVMGLSGKRIHQIEARSLYKLKRIMQGQIPYVPELDRSIPGQIVRADCSLGTSLG